MCFMPPGLLHGTNFCFPIFFLSFVQGKSGTTCHLNIILEQNARKMREKMTPRNIAKLRHNQDFSS
eukprot:TRINITY_DN7358_c0_g1_i1.p1 TRINITY_DN7358_c0_g1~~TRINITY_DN7358_c0_g1_i1.p1  ORF type:complete len:66 (+),score=1.92 TRINITY_DN7358_c0_g1_i1:134-331(+)